MRGFDISRGGGGGGKKFINAINFFPGRYITGRAYEWVRGRGWLRCILFTRLLILFLFRSS